MKSVWIIIIYVDYIHWFKHVLSFTDNTVIAQ